MAFIDSGQNFDKEAHQLKMKRLLENMNVKSYNFRIPAPLYKKVKAKLAEDEKTFRAVLIDMLLNYIEK